MTLVSVNAEQLAAVVELACLTESRTNDEQKALLAVAERCDKKRNAKVSTNVHPAKDAMWMPMREEDRVGDDPDGWLVRISRESVLEQHADRSRLLEPEAGERHVKPSWERKKKR